MKTVFIYAVAAHDSTIINNEKIIETLEKARENGFERIIIIKKSQLAAKTKELSRLFEVCPYPKSSLNKAIANCNACMVIGNGMATNRKKKITEEIVKEANKKLKFIFSLNIY